MRAYTVATAAVALGASTKWLDNVLSHHRVIGVVQSAQGRTRRLNEMAVTVLDIALALSQDAALPMARAIRLSEAIVEAGGALDLPGGARILIDLEAVRTRLTGRLAEAVEFAPLPRRGRPPHR